MVPRKDEAHEAASASLGGDPHTVGGARGTLRQAINAEYNVAGLCAEFPDRLQACMDHGGERLAK